MDPISLAFSAIGLLSKFATGTGVVGKIAGALAGPDAKKAADKVVNTIGAMFGPEAAADPKVLELELQKDRAKADLALAQLNKDLEFFRLEVEDTKSARAQTVALAQSESSIAWGAPIISIAVTVGFITILTIWLLRPPGESDQVLALLVGTLAASFTQVTNYWLGSSSGSKSKDVSISSLARKSSDRETAAANENTPAERFKLFK